jgi:heptosyltransferase-1
MSLQQKTNKLPKDILFIPSGSIGDALMMFALCDELLQFKPEYRITILVRRNASLLKDLSAAYPNIQVVTTGKSIRGAFRFFYTILRKPYVALMPVPFGASSIWNTNFFFKLLSLRPGSTTAGLLRKEGENLSYDLSAVYDTKKLYIDNLRILANLAGLTVLPEGSPVHLRLNTRMPKGIAGNYIVFHPFGSSSWKSWPPRRSKILLQLLTQKYPGYSLLISAAREDAKEAHEIADAVPNVQVLENLPILEVAGVIQNAALYIGVDTGITHIAGVLAQKRIVLSHNIGKTWRAIYNPNAVILTNDEHCVCTGEKGPECNVVEDGKSYTRCLYDITDEQILQAVDHFLPHAKA